MVVSHREPSISSNIRAIIEQLNLNPVERRRLIDKTGGGREGAARCRNFPADAAPVDLRHSPPPKITIGVYGCEERDELTLPAGPIKPACRFKIDDRSRSRAEARQRLAAQMKWETRPEYANEVKRSVAIAIGGSLSKDDSRARSTTTTKILPRGHQRSTTIMDEHAPRIADTTIEVIDRRRPVATGFPGEFRDERVSGAPRATTVTSRDHRSHVTDNCVTSNCVRPRKDEVAVSIRPPICKIEDRPVGPRQSDTANGDRIRRATTTKERTRAEDDPVEITRSTRDAVERIVPIAKEDLPQLESASLNHTAAHHRISVRPKNRRPPRRTTPTTPNVVISGSPSIPPTIVEDTLDSLDQQQQQQQQQSTSNASSPTEPKTIGVIRKSSSRLSRNSDIFEELESRLPRKSSAASLSPDSLDVTTTSRSSAEMAEEQQTTATMTTTMMTATTMTTTTTTMTTTDVARSVARRPSNRISKASSDVFEELEAKLPHSRRSSSNRLSKSPDSLDSASCWFSKSTEGFEKYEEAEYEEPSSKPVVKRLLLNPISKSTDRVSKSSDSLEAIEPLASDDSIERRRSSFEFRARRSSKAISKSSESFDVLEQQSDCANEEAVIGCQELQKRSSVSDINLSRGRRLSKSISKSSESFERIDTSETKDVEAEVTLEDVSKGCCRRSSKRMSSESSDNLDLDDKLENRRVRRTPKRIPSVGIMDVASGDDREGEKRPTPTRKPPRLQKSSESSELGSTDTLDSERRNKSSESTETLDSLEKDLEQDRKDEEITDSVVDKREKNDSWSSRNLAATDSDQTSMADDTDDSKSLISTDKYYWRQSSEPAKENLGIHQLLAITIVTRMADNGNNQRSPVIYPKKKQQMSTSQPTSPVAKQEDTKMLFDNLLVGKNDEDLQNMLNGNISEVSTDTKSFKEKLIMFEKLGK